MASFLAGPTAHLVGAGMQAIGVGIPVGETSSKVIEGLRNCGVPMPPKTWFKRKGANGEQQRTRDDRPNKTVYDKLESHINGVIQVVKPAIELKKLVRENCCKSAQRPGRATSRSPQDKSIYYTPQKCSSARVLFDDRRSAGPKQRKASKRPGKRGARRCSKQDGSSDSDEDEHCVYCSRSRSLLELPCGRLICSKCDETGDHESELKMSRRKKQLRLPLENQGVIIDLTEDSPSNTNFRPARIQRRYAADIENNDCRVVIPLDDSAEYYDVDVQRPNIQRHHQTAEVVDLENTITIEDIQNEETEPKQSVLDESSSTKKGHLTCPVCFENLTDNNMAPMSTPCGHVYCSACLKKMIKLKKKCPLCQRSFSLSKCIRLHI